MRSLKQSTAFNQMVFMVDSSDHVTGKASLTLTITASKDGGAFGSISPTVTERGNGWYSLALTSSHTDTLGDFALHITGTGADPTDCLMLVVAADFADSANLGLSTLSTLLSRLSSARAGYLDNLNISGFVASATVLTQVQQLLRNKRILDPVTGIETVYDDSGVVMFTRQVYENAAGTQTYRDGVADRVERFA